MDLSAYLRDVPDFPKPGILFKDITPLLADPKALSASIDQLAEFGWPGVTRVVGIESRGFIFGVPLAMKMGLGFTPVRKPGKLPWKTYSEEYSLEYGTDRLEIHQDGVAHQEKVLIVDDLLATGGTMEATCRLVEAAGGEVVGCVTLVELGFLDGRKRLSDRRFEAVITV
jgi:adenine phosphoribosyltransferase